MLLRLDFCPHYATLGRMKKLLFSILGISSLFGGFFSLFTAPEVSAQQAPVMEFYHGAECPHCHAEKKWFPTLLSYYPDLVIEEYEVWHAPENQKKMQARLKELGKTSGGVPTNIIGDSVIVGFNPEGILAALEANYGPPYGEGIDNIEQDLKENNPNAWKRFLEYSWPLMSFMLGLVDGFNPCAMWSLFILIGYLLSLEQKSKRYLVGGIFIGTSALMYFSVLLAYLFGFSEVSKLIAGSIMVWVFRAVGLLAVGTGIYAVIMARKQGIDCDVRDAQSKKAFASRIGEILAREKLWLILAGVTGLAISVNLIELLCSFAIPTAFTATLVASDMSLMSQLIAILIYTFAYMLDDLVVFLLAMWTMSLKVFSPKVVQVSHLVGGIILVLVGALLLVRPDILATLGA